MSIDARQLRATTIRTALFAAAMLASVAGTMGCSSNGGRRPPDASNQDSFSIDYHFGDLPSGCPPATGNDKHVGAPCLKAGDRSQCGGNLICSCQPFLGFTPPDDTPCFCTIPILALCDTIPAGYCGQGATCCGYMNAGSICVPDACVPQMQCPVF